MTQHHFGVFIKPSSQDFLSPKVARMFVLQGIIGRFPESQSFSLKIELLFLTCYNVIKNRIIMKIENLKK